MLSEAYFHQSRIYDKTKKNKLLLWNYNWVYDKPKVLQQNDSINDICYMYALLVSFALQVELIRIAMDNILPSCLKFARGGSSSQ